MIIPLTEGFDNASGQFTNYDSYQTVDRANIATLTHRDIRVMQQATLTAGQLEGATILRTGEAWSGASSTVAVDATRGGLRVLSIPLIAGTVTVTSTMTTRPVDILTGFADTDHISMALPTFPAGSVTQSTSFLDFTSEPTGNFATGPTASVALSASLVALTAGNSEFRVLRSAFNQNGIDLTQITAVRLRIVASGVNTMRVMSIRLLAAGWTMGTVDMDTRYQRLVRSIPRNGDTTLSGFTWPIMWRSEQPSGAQDPRPIDSEFATIFSTGSMAASNSMTLYFREVTEDYMTMLDLDGLAMTGLDGHEMPDTGTAMYTGRTMADLAQFTHFELDDEDQLDLQRMPDYLSASWISFNLIWGVSGTQIQMGNTESGDPGASGNYTFVPAALSANSTYVWFCKLEENSVRSTIYTITSTGAVGNLVYDTTTIIDDSAFHRRKGRFGWFAALSDGDAYVDSIRARKINYAEYRSLPFQSFTPVIGAELFFVGADNIEHYQNLAPAPSNVSATLVSRDSARTTTSSSWRLDNLGSNANQGLQSNLFSLEDFDDTEISFDLWYTADPASFPITPYLLSESGRAIQLYMPKVIPNQWQHITIRPPTGQMMLTGNYSFELLQTTAAPLTWWVDNVNIFERSLTWEGRSVIDDPWNSNTAQWTPFKNALNRPDGGILFPLRGTNLQVRAKACTQNAYIDQVQFKPRYAPLGNFKPKATIPRVAPTASFTSVSAGIATLTLTSTSTPAAGSFNINNEWNFGDGTSGIGNVVKHVYPATGSYVVTLVTTDSNGNRGVTSGSVTA